MSSTKVAQVIAEKNALDLMFIIVVRRFCYEYYNTDKRPRINIWSCTTQYFYGAGKKTPFAFVKKRMAFGLQKCSELPSRLHVIISRKRGRIWEFDEDRLRKLWKLHQELSLGKHRQFGFDLWAETGVGGDNDSDLNRPDFDSVTRELEMKEPGGVGVVLSR
ncbi:MAG: hypothetical protein JWQ02_4359 [Capsulimonas sp.]|nr:hypothetical protein [Capsulimonas sp.]